MKKIVITVACGMVLFAAGDNIEVLQKACDSGNAKSCAAVGLLYEKGQGLEQDYKKASELYSKACDMRDANACEALGLLYNDGKGIKQNHKKASELFSKACD